MSDFDMNRAGLLLHVCDLAGQWPNLNGLTGLAMRELELLSKDAAKRLADIIAEEKKKADEDAAVIAAEQAKERQRVEEEQAAQADAQAKAKEAAQKAKFIPPVVKPTPEEERIHREQVDAEVNAAALKTGTSSPAQATYVPPVVGGDELTIADRRI